MVDVKKFQGEPSHTIEIVGRHIEVTDGMKNYAKEKLAKFDRLDHMKMEFHVTMDIQKLDHIVDIICYFHHFKVKVHATTTDMYASIDRAVDKLQKKVRRWKERIIDLCQKGPSFVDMTVDVLDRPVDEVTEYNAEIDAANLEQETALFQAPKVISTEKKLLKTLTIQEALMKMDLSGDAFLIFRGEEDRKIRVLYRRKEGNYGVIQVE